MDLGLLVPNCKNPIPYLSALSVIFVLACEMFAFEAIQDFSDSFRRLGQHRLQRHSRRQFALFLEVVDPNVEQCRDDLVICRELAASH